MNWAIVRENPWLDFLLESKDLEDVMNGLFDTRKVPITLYTMFDIFLSIMFDVNKTFFFNRLIVCLSVYEIKT